MDAKELSKNDAGNSFFELIEFSLKRKLKDGCEVSGLYGINVAKVREVIRMQPINPLASSLEGIEGIFEMRGVPIPAINVAKVLGDSEAVISPNDQIIIIECSKRRAGLIVQSARKIRRLKWEQVLPPTADDNSCITGLVVTETKDFLFILDVEEIIFRLESASKDTSNEGNFQPIDAVKPNLTGQTVLLVDDSPIILKNTRAFLQKLGLNVLLAENGKRALKILNDPCNSIDLVVTDVEMPQLDGLSLIEKIREISRYKNLPILLHSSLSGDATKEAGIKAGADGYIVKNNFSDLVSEVKKILEMDKANKGTEVA